MGKKTIVPLFLVLLFLLVITPSYLMAGKAFAHHRAQVLGVSVQASELDFPKVSAGPGSILPDSPFFVFDVLWQKVKLATALTPEQKARIHTQIAGERLAELRIMMARNNLNGIGVSLSQMEKEAQQASTELSQAAAGGQNVEEAAKQLNEAIKFQRDVVGNLSDQSSGELKLKLKASKESLKASKVEVEDKLPPELLDNEIENELELKIEDDSADLEDKSLEIENSIEELNNQASEAAKKSQEKREEAIKKAIERKNEQLKKEHESLLRTEKLEREQAKKQQELLREKAKNAAEAAKELNEQASSSNSGSGGESSSSGSSNSGSGSSNSGSGSSGGGGED